MASVQVSTGLRLRPSTDYPPGMDVLALIHGDPSRAQARAMLAAAGAPNPERDGEHLVACIDGLLFIRTLQQTARRQLVAARDAWHRSFGFVVAIGTLRDLGIDCGGR